VSAGVVFSIRRDRHSRADVSLISSWLSEALSARAGTGTPVPYDELPITQGVASLIADSLAAMDLYPVDLNGNPTGETFPILEQPNPDEDRAETIHKIAQSMFWTGNGYALKGPVDLTSGAVDAITVINPDRVGVDPDEYDDLRVRSWTIDGQTYGRQTIQLWKINDDPRKGPLGRSPLKRCATALDTYGWAYRYLGDYFAGGGNPGSILKSKLELDPTKITELAAEWASARKQARPAFLPQWLDFEVPPSSGELRDVVEVLSNAAAEVARMLNLPVSLVNAPVAGYSLQYSNVGDEFRRWLAVSLGTTWIARIERGFSQLLPPERRARLDPSNLFRPDLFPDAGPAAPQMLPASPMELPA